MLPNRGYMSRRNRTTIASPLGLPEGPVVIVRVPQSLAAPHMITLYTKKHLRRNFTSGITGVIVPMDAGEIRATFVLYETKIGY